MPRNPRIWSCLSATRRFHDTPARLTDGVFSGLTDGRHRLPWIEAFRRQQAGENVASSENDPGERDMAPKKMSDSYHRVVLPLGRDPSLSDTYINSSGHIRYCPGPSLARSHDVDVDADADADADTNAR